MSGSLFSSKKKQLFQFLWGHQHLFNAKSELRAWERILIWYWSILSRDLLFSHLISGIHIKGLSWISLLISIQRLVASPWRILHQPIWTQSILLVFQLHSPLFDLGRDNLPSYSNYIHSTSTSLVSSLYSHESRRRHLHRRIADHLLFQGTLKSSCHLSKTKNTVISLTLFTESWYFLSIGD